MKLVLLLTGKTDQAWIRDGVAEYEKRISKYARLEIVTLPDVKNPGNRPAEWVKSREAEKMLSFFRIEDHVVLLDERGQAYSTLEMAGWLRKAMMLPAKRMVFVISIEAHFFTPDGTVIVRRTAIQGTLGQCR